MTDLKNFKSCRILVLYRLRYNKSLSIIYMYIFSYNLVYVASKLKGIPYQFTHHLVFCFLSIKFYELLIFYKDLPYVSKIAKFRVSLHYFRDFYGNLFNSNLHLKKNLMHPASFSFKNIELDIWNESGIYSLFSLQRKTVSKKR